MTASQSTHGHEILQIILESKPPVTRATLTHEAARRFGPDARYYTCSAEGMSLAELLAFLTARGKVIEHDGVLTADVGQICDHGE